MSLTVDLPRIFLLLLLISSPPSFIQQAKNLAIADSKLIQTLCNNSDTPQTCLNCVQSSKGAEKADSVGVAIIVVNCITDKAKALAHNLTNLASTFDHGNLKSLSRKCANAYGNHIAHKELVSAKKALQIHKYDKAESCVVRALNFDLDCYKGLKKYSQDKVPSDVFHEMKIYEELSESACRIIEKIYV